jgi:tRNA (adenine37-N6)-methyltransferase
MTYTMRAIGVARTPFASKVDAPRQAQVARDVAGKIELYPETGFLDAVEGIELWSRLWLLFVFDRDPQFAPKVAPPRSAGKVGVLGTRSPHRPNPIGLSCVRLMRREGLTLHVQDIDLLDGTPILDIKPYVPYADAFPDATHGWLTPPSDPLTAYAVEFSALAASQFAWLDTRDVPLAAQTRAALALGPEPHAYRRIRCSRGSMRQLALKEWRIYFEPHDARRIIVHCIESGFKPAELAQGRAPAPHGEFAAAFGMPRGIDAFNI